MKLTEVSRLNATYSLLFWTIKHIFGHCFNLSKMTAKTSSLSDYKMREARPFSLPNTPQPNRNYWWFILIGVVSIYAAFNVEDFDFLVEKDGAYDLSPQRKKKYKKEVEEIDNAEQYVIYALKPGYYPCYNCGKLTMIFLNAGEVWKYGVTRIGQNRRYAIDDIPENLQYRREFIGDYAACLKLEKYKIYHYALLPENLNRAIPLIRPPGNKVDF